MPSPLQAFGHGPPVHWGAVRVTSTTFTIQYLKYAPFSPRVAWVQSLEQRVSGVASLSRSDEGDHERSKYKTRPYNTPVRNWSRPFESDATALMPGARIVTATEKLEPSGKVVRWTTKVATPQSMKGNVTKFVPHTASKSTASGQVDF